MSATVEMRNITMAFGPNEVLKGIDLELASPGRSRRCSVPTAPASRH